MFKTITQTFVYMHFLCLPFSLLSSNTGHITSCRVSTLEGSEARRDVTGSLPGGRLPWLQGRLILLGPPMGTVVPRLLLSDTELWLWSLLLSCTLSHLSHLLSRAALLDKNGAPLCPQAQRPGSYVGGAYALRGDTEVPGVHWHSRKPVCRAGGGGRSGD